MPVGAGEADGSGAGHLDASVPRPYRFPLPYRLIAQ